MLGNKPSNYDEWIELFTDFIDHSKNTAEAINKVQEYIQKNYSFELPAGATPYLYFGSVDNDIRMWQVIDDFSKKSNEQCGYISSTEAGKLFNNDNFNDALKDVFRYEIKANNGTPDKELEGMLYEGQHHSGKILFKDGSSAQAFNDFFSKNYVLNMHSKNVNVIVAGEPKAADGEGYNCFFRTELPLILSDELVVNGEKVKNPIETINNKPKSLLEKPFNAKNEEGINFIVTYLQSTQAEECARILYSKDIIIDKEKRNVNIDVTNAAYTYVMPDSTPYDSHNSYLLGKELLDNNKINDFKSAYLYMNNYNYTEDELKLVKHSIKAGQKEYELMSKENIVEVLFDNDFNIKTVLLNKLKEEKAQRQGNFDILQNENTDMHAPNKTEHRIYMSQKKKQDSLDAYNINRPGWKRFGNDADSVQIHTKRNYNDIDADNNSETVKRKKMKKTHSVPTR